MTATLLAVLLAPAALAGAPAAPVAPAAVPAAASVKASTAAAAAPPLIGLSTYTVSTLYTGDRVRDPFLPPSMGVAPRVREAGAPVVWDIHAMQLRGIMKDARSDFALFSTEDGTTLVLRGGRLYDDREKPVPGITGRIHIKQRRAELVTTDKDVQVYSLGGSEGKDESDNP